MRVLDSKGNPISWVTVATGLSSLLVNRTEESDSVRKSRDKFPYKLHNIDKIYRY